MAFRQDGLWRGCFSRTWPRSEKQPEGFKHGEQDKKTDRGRQNSDHRLLKSRPSRREQGKYRQDDRGKPPTEPSVDRSGVLPGRTKRIGTNLARGNAFSFCDPGRVGHSVSPLRDRAPPPCRSILRPPASQWRRRINIAGPAHENAGRDQLIGRTRRPAQNRRIGSAGLTPLSGRSHAYRAPTDGRRRRPSCVEAESD